jgi:transcriptional regulator with XRE-family HTH domain
MSYMDGGALLRKTRLRLGLDQADLARRAGTTQTYVSRIERGVVSPSVRTLRRLMNAMGADLRMEAEPLSPGNASARDLRADFLELTPEQRVDEAMELSEFLTDLAATAAETRPPAT